MTKDVTRSHYGRLAATYDQNWASNPEFIPWMSDRIQDRLKISTGQAAADIGCGTGLYARGLAAHAAVVACADPSPAMLAQLPADSRLIPVTASAEDLAAGRATLPHDRYDAILLKESLHHVPPASRPAVITGLARLLRPGGRMLVVMLPAHISYPLFPEALELFESRQPDPAAITALMHAAGLRTELTHDSFPLTFPVPRYLQMVRDRYMSLLAEFTGPQIEAGIARIRRDHRGEQITFTDTFAFILGTAS
jgi:SAM-dependent methyltransferase